MVAFTVNKTTVEAFLFGNTQYTEAPRKQTNAHLFIRAAQDLACELVLKCTRRSQDQLPTHSQLK
jgi:hypothetical protein